MNRGCCGSCEHFNLYWIITEHPSSRGKWGTCLYPYRMNLDDIDKLDELRKKGIVKDVKVDISYSCKNYIPIHAYGGQG